MIREIGSIQYDTSTYHDENTLLNFKAMNVTELNAGISHIEEIRASLTRFRESGKPVIAYADNFSQAGYYLATAADKIYINPGGMLPLTGLTINVLFLLIASITFSAALSIFFNDLKGNKSFLVGFKNRFISFIPLCLSIFSIRLSACTFLCSSSINHSLFIDLTSL